jgi:hypothetical protein
VSKSMPTIDFAVFSGLPPTRHGSQETLSTTCSRMTSEIDASSRVVGRVVPFFLAMLAVEALIVKEKPQKNTFQETKETKLLRPKLQELTASPGMCNAK